MNDFTFHIPTKILFGRGWEEAIGAEIAAAGIKKVLLVHGRDSARRSGLLSRVEERLREAGITVVDFGGVVSNPVLSHIRPGIALARAEAVEAVLAVGGGSVVDESKTIAAGVRCDHDVWDFFIGRREISAALPVFTILTLAATGSEMNAIAVVTNEETKQKYNIRSPHVYPRVSILNPELTFTVGPDYSAYSGVDAIAHVIEAYFTRSHSPRLQDRLVEAIVLTVMETTEAILKKPDDYQARAEFMWAATLALNGITTAGVTGYGFPNHMIEHSLSALYNIPHGAGLAIVIPAWMRWYINRPDEGNVASSRDCAGTTSRNRQQFDRFATTVFGLAGGLAGIEALEQWFRKIGAPTRLADWQINAGDIGMIAENAARLAVQWGMGAAYPATAIAEILSLAV